MAGGFFFVGKGVGMENRSFVFSFENFSLAFFSSFNCYGSFFFFGVYRGVKFFIFCDDVGVNENILEAQKIVIHNKY